MFEAKRKGVQVAEQCRTIVTHSAAETQAEGRLLGSTLRGGEVVLLTGELGAGKSVFAHGVGEALGVSRWRGSPTFALVHEYPSAPNLAHVDLYRLTEEDVPDLGLEEYSGGSWVLLVEWADRAGEFVRELALGRLVRVHLEHEGADRRALTMVHESPVGAGHGAC